MIILRAQPDGSLLDITAQVEAELAAQPEQPQDSGQRFLAMWDESAGIVTTVEFGSPVHGLPGEVVLVPRGVYVEPLTLGDDRRPRSCE